MAAGRFRLADSIITKTLITMKNLKDKLLPLILALLALLSGERIYDYATKAPELDSYAYALPPAYEEGSRDIRNTRYELLVTYEVTRLVEAPAGLPGGYTVTQLYTYPLPVVLHLRKEPTLADIAFSPPALAGSPHLAVSFEVLSRKRNVIDDEPIEKEPARAETQADGI